MNRETAIVTDGSDSSDGEVLVERKRSTTVTIDETQHDSEPETSALSPVPLTPTGTPKSILKRAQSMRQRRPSDEKRDKLSPLKSEQRQESHHRADAHLLADVEAGLESSNRNEELIETHHISIPKITPLPTPPPPQHHQSRIPKLQVHWPETSSVCSEPVYATLPRSAPSSRLRPMGNSQLPPPTAVRRQNRAHSMVTPTLPLDVTRGSRETTPENVSVTSSSSVVGTWWFGRDTRSVPHCERRHLKHEAAPYQTPTQRHSKDMKEMEKRLKLSDKSLEDKEKHLTQLRARLDELEAIIDTNTTLSENHRLQSQITEIKHENDRLQSERTHLVRDCQRRLSLHDVPKISIGSMTVRVGQESIGTGSANDEAVVESFTIIDDLRLEVNNKQDELVRLNSVILQLRTDNELKTQMSQINGITNAMLPGSTHDISDVKIQAQLEAYRLEALAWRTRAAQLDLAMKEMQNDLVVRGFCTLDTATVVAKEARHRGSTITMPNGNPADATLPDIENLMNDSGYSPIVDVSTECLRESCRQHRREADEQIDELSGKLVQVNDKLDDTEAELHHSSTKLLHTNDRLAHTEEALEGYKRQYEQNKTKFDAAGLSVSRLQEENINLKANVEEQHEHLEQVRTKMIESGFYVGRKILCVDPSYTENYSKFTQTELTSDALTLHEDEFKMLYQKLADAKRRYQAEGQSMAENVWTDTITEVQESLKVKTHLVTTLSQQVNAVNDEFERAREAMDMERETYSLKLADLSEIAARVPVLEIELRTANEMLMLAEKQLADEKDEYDSALEVSIEKHMQNTADTIEYWREKMYVSEKHDAEHLAHIKHLENELCVVKMRTNIEKVNIFDQLQHSYGEVSDLHSIVYKSKTDAGMMAKPDVSDVHVTVTPDVSENGTQFVKGDLYDEVDERLKLTLGELATTERQVQVLQDKLQAKIYECTRSQSHAETLTMAKVQLEGEHLELQEQQQLLQDEHDKVAHRCSQLTDTTKDMTAADRNRFRQLEAEFDNVRLEMEAIINRYEAEKRRLKDRNTALTTTNDELRKEVASMVETNNLGQMLCTMSLGSGAGSSIAGDDMMFEFDMLEHRLDVLTGDSALMATAEGRIMEQEQTAKQQLTVGDVDGSKLSPRRKARKNAPAIKFLLERLQTEREKHCATNETLEKQVRELNSVVEMIEASSVAQKVVILRSQSQPNLAADEAHNMESASAIVAHTARVDSTMVATLRTKNLCLMKENQRLISEFALVREQVTVVLDKQHALQTVAERSGMTSPVPGGNFTAGGLTSDDTDKESIYEEVSEHLHVLPAPTATVAKSKPVTGGGFLSALASTFTGRGAHQEATELSDSLEQVQFDDDVIVEPGVAVEVAPNTTTLPQPPQAAVTAVCRPSGDLASDLNEVRIDLQDILEKIDTATTAGMGGKEDAQRENRLMMWLERELNQEQNEMALLHKWYDDDKRRLEEELSAIKAERAVIRGDNDVLTFDFHDVCRELQLYKMEEAERIGLLGAVALIKYRSYEDLRGCRAERQDWKHKYAGVYRDFLGIQGSFEIRDRKCRELQIDNDMLAGEVLILRAEYELQSERHLAVSEVSQDGVTLESTELFISPSASDDSSSKMKNLYDTHLTTLKAQLHTSTDIEKSLRQSNAKLEGDNRIMGQQVSSLRLDLHETTEELDELKRRLELAVMERPSTTDAGVQPALVYNDVESEVTELKRQLQKTVGELGDLRQFEEQRLNIASIKHTSVETNTDPVQQPSPPTGTEMWTQAMVSTVTTGTNTPAAGTTPPTSVDLADIESVMSASMTSSPATGNRPLIRVQASFSSVSLESSGKGGGASVQESVKVTAITPQPPMPVLVEMGMQTDDVFVSSLDLSTMTRSAHSTLSRPCKVKSTKVTLGTPLAVKRERETRSLQAVSMESFGSSGAYNDSDDGFGLSLDLAEQISEVLSKELPSVQKCSITSIDGHDLPTFRERSMSAPASSSPERGLLRVAAECDRVLSRSPGSGITVVEIASKSESSLKDVAAKELDQIYAEMERECEQMKLDIDRTSNDVMSRSQTEETKLVRAQQDFTRREQALKDSMKSQMVILIHDHDAEVTTLRKSILAVDESEAIANLRKELVGAVNEKNTTIHRLQGEISRLETELTSMMVANTLREAKPDVSNLSIAAPSETWLNVPSKVGGTPTDDGSHYQSADWSEASTSASYHTAQSAGSQEVAVLPLDDRSDTPKPGVEIVHDSDEFEHMRTEMTLLNAELQSTRLEAKKEIRELTTESDGLRRELLEAVGKAGGSVGEAKEDIQQLEHRIEELTTEMSDQQEQHQHDNLAMFMKGQEAANYEHDSGTLTLFDNPETGSGREQSEPPGSSAQGGVARGKGQLSDDQVTLRFLRDATFYYLVMSGKKDTNDHLNAIMTLLRFNAEQRTKVGKLKHH